MKNKQETTPEDFLQSRQGKSESELYAELLETAAKSKRDGTLNEESISAFEQTVEPMLNEAQKAKLKELLEKIRGC